MQDLHSYYKVNANVTKEKLRSYGFRLSKGKCYYDSWVYKDFIKLTVIIDLSELYYTYQVKNKSRKYHSMKSINYKVKEK